jgi:hypothetical protein
LLSRSQTLRFRKSTRAITRHAPAFAKAAARSTVPRIEPTVAETLPDQQRPISQGSADIDIAMAAECSAIMQDFARRLAGAKTGSERRAIKDQRKSALAAAREKAKRLKEGRRAAFSAALQNTRRKPPPKPRR